MNLRYVKIVWIPIFGVWSFLVAIYLNSLGGRSLIERPPLAIAAYIFVSAFLATHVSKELSRPSASTDSIYKIITSYSSAWTLVVATLFAFMGTFSSRENEIWACLFVLASLVVYLVSNGLSEYANEQLNEGARLRANARKTTNNLRSDYKAFLDQLLLQHPDSPALKTEIVRVVRIIPYSSFFRSDKATITLSSLLSENDPERLSVLLSEIQ